MSVHELEITGSIDGITYHNPEDNYTVARIKPPGKDHSIVIAGTLPSVNPGEEIVLRGYWYNHPKYGEQFKVLSCRVKIPATLKGMERYLSSGLIKGIGPFLARRLIERFKEGIFDVIENDAERLLEVEGIGRKKLESIKRAWEEQKGIRDVMVFLQEYGISPAWGARIYKRYGVDTVKVLRGNPYRLAIDVSGIGFLTADRIARNLGIPQDSPSRLSAGILHILHESTEKGHVYQPYEPLIDECMKTLKVEREPIVKAIAELFTEGRVVIEDLNRDGEFKENNKAVYLSGYHTAERGIAFFLKRLLKTPDNLELMDVDGMLSRMENSLGIVLSDEQKTAVRMALREKVVVITGGPGTGKTTIINCILRVYRELGKKVLLSAPTGRAAKRMTESTGYPASTVHRLLEYSPKDGRFQRDEHHPLNADLVVLDETSMMDVSLMYHLLKAIPPEKRLVVVGDVDQLPSVGPGNVLRDIMDSGVIPVAGLRRIFRQDEGSTIALNAHRINSGRMPVMDRRNRDFFFIEADDPEKVVRIIIELCSERIPHRFGFDPLSDIQVITPMNRGVAGTGNLNTELQKVLNPDGYGMKAGGRFFRTGDKIMQTKNNYDKEVYNGDTGRIVYIDGEEGRLTVDYDGRKVDYELSELDEITLAYAISVHKSQGSEYPVVIMPVMTQHYVLLQRNLLYTGITRGKRLCVLVGTKKALAIGIKNSKTLRRFTLLRERLMD